MRWKWRWWPKWLWAGVDIHAHVNLHIDIYLVNYACAYACVQNLFTNTYMRPQVDTFARACMHELTRIVAFAAWCAYLVHAPVAVFL